MGMKRPAVLIVTGAAASILIASAAASAHSGLPGGLVGLSDQTFGSEASGARLGSPEPSESPEASPSAEPSEKPEATPRTEQAETPEPAEAPEKDDGSRSGSGDGRGGHHDGGGDHQED
jgi:hypothetical protein